MAKLNEYKVYPKGKFMMPCKIVLAINHEMAMRDPMGGNNIDSIVMEIGIAHKEWWLISADGGYSKPIATLSNGQTVGAWETDPSKRILFEKACGTALEESKKNPSLEFADFENELKQYQKTYETSKKESIQNRKQTIKIVAVCLKDCIVAEMATIDGNGEKAGKAMVHARGMVEEAYKYAQRSQAAGDAQPNTAWVAATHAREQFDKTIKKNRELRKIIIVGRNNASKKIENNDATLEIN